MEKVEEFEIRPDILCDVHNAHKNAQAREIIAEFLVSKGLVNTTQELFDGCLKRRHPHLEVWRECLHYFTPVEIKRIYPFPKAKLNLNHELEALRYDQATRFEKMVSLLMNYLDVDDPVPDQPSFNKVNHYYFFGESEGYFQVPHNGVILNQYVEIERLKYPLAFRFFFAYVFKQTSKPIEFLSYHFEKTFKRNLSDYKDFLFITEKENPELISHGKRIWDKWIEDVPSLNVSTEQAKNFKALFKDENSYNALIAELSKDNPERWFDLKGNYVRVGKGNDNPGAVCDLLNFLRIYKYFKSEVDQSIENIPNLAKSCFGVSVGKKSSRRDHTGRPYDQLIARFRNTKN